MGKTAAKLILGGAIAALLLLAGYDAAFGQGEINFYTYNVNPNYGIVFQTNGTTRASGTAFKARLYGSTTEDGTFVPIGEVATFLTGTYAGYVDYGMVTVNGIAAGTLYYCELVVWTMAGSYEMASTTPGAQIGISEVVPLVLGEEGSNVYPVPFPNEFHNFTLTLVPEPASVVLMGLGGLSLWLFRRRK